MIKGATLLQVRDLTTEFATRSGAARAVDGVARLSGFRPESALS